MTETTINQFVSSGTNAERLAYTPVLATPASGNDPSVIFTETDTGDTYMWDFGGGAWQQINGAGITQLTGDVTAGPGSGSQAATIANNAVTTAKINNAAVTLAKIASAAANSKLLGSGSAGSGSAYAELTLGTGLSMSGTTLSASGSGGTVTTSGSPASGNLAFFSGSTVITSGDLTGDVTTSGTSATTIGALKIATGMVQDAAITLAKIQNAAASSKLLGSGASGSGSAYVELTLGTGLSMSGTTLNASGGGGGTVTNTGTLTSGQLIFGNGTVDITVGNLSGDVSTSGSGVTTIGALKIATGMIQASAVTLAKIQNAAANSKLLGSGDTGSGSAYAEISLGSGLTMTGTTLSASGGGGGGGLPWPQGRLTLTSGVPVLTANTTAASSVYYTPYQGADIPIYDGAAWATMVFAELTMALDTSNQLSGYVYDLFVWNDSGTLKIGAGPAWINTATVTWTSATPGVCSWTAHGLSEGDPVIFTAGTSTPTGITAGTTYYVSPTGLTANAFSVSTSIANAAAGTNVATSSTGSGTQTGTNHTRLRGTGAGTTELTRLNGLMVNANSITLTNGAGAGTSGIAANTATYVGSILCTANGQTGMNFNPSPASGGTNNILGVYNAYCRVRTVAYSRDSSTNWTYASTTWRPSNNNVLSRITVLDGLAQSAVAGRRQIYANGYGGVAMNRNSATATASIIMQGTGTGTPSPLGITDEWLPLLGASYIQAMEASESGSTTFYANQTGPTRPTERLSIELEM